MSKLQQYTAIIEKEDNLYVALCPELDIASQGETASKVRNKLLNLSGDIFIPELIF